MTKGILFDLDGVLLDYSFRFHKTYEDVLIKHNLPCPERHAIMDMRRQCRNSQIEMLDRFLIPQDLANRQQVIVQCAEERAQIIEDERYVSLDRFFEGAIDVVKDLKQRGFITGLITRRKNKELFEAQIKPYRASFDFLETAFQKKPAIQRFLDNYYPSPCYCLTDTGNDVQDGKALGLTVIGVLSGLENEERLKTAGADFTIKFINEVYPIVT